MSFMNRMTLLQVEGEAAVHDVVVFELLSAVAEGEVGVLSEKTCIFG